MYITIMIFISSHVGTTLALIDNCDEKSGEVVQRHGGQEGSQDATNSCTM